jgi:hypothetical protein
VGGRGEELYEVLHNAVGAVFDFRVEGAGRDSIEEGIEVKLVVILGRSGR